PVADAEADEVDNGHSHERDANEQHERALQAMQHRQGEYVEADIAPEGGIVHAELGRADGHPGLAPEVLADPADDQAECDASDGSDEIERLLAEAANAALTRNGHVSGVSNREPDVGDEDDRGE